MDALAYHPYPASSTDPIAKGLPWPNAGVPNLDRIKQAVWDAFHGTAQPTFESGLGLVVSEVGWQVGVVAPSAWAYSGRENVAVTDEATQAAIYGELVRRLSCDPAVTDLLFLHLIDESDLAGFQSGLERADGSHRSSYDAVKTAIAQTHGACIGTPVMWRHATGVVGGPVSGWSGARCPLDLGSAGPGVPGGLALPEVRGDFQKHWRAILGPSLAHRFEQRLQRTLVL